jgi:micrococcal nuclease
MARRLLPKKIVTSLIMVGLVLAFTAMQQQGWLGEAPQQAADKAVDKAVQSQPGLYEVSRFIDGDTIAVKMDGKDESIRMIGIDTPETHKPNTPVQCYGPAASAYMKGLIGDQKVRLEADPKSQNRDRYDRLLRYVYLPDGRLVAKESIASGHGFAYTQFPFTKSDEFVAAQEEAKAAAKGLWGNCNPYQEKNGRWQTENAS